MDDKITHGEDEIAANISDAYKEENIRGVKRAVSRNGINLSIFLLSANIIALLLLSVYLTFDFVLSQSLDSLINTKELTHGAELIGKILSVMSSEGFKSAITAWINIISMYFVAFPIFIFTQNGFERRKYKTGGLGAKEFFALIPIGLFLMNVGAFIGETIAALLSSVINVNLSNSTIDIVESTPLPLTFVMVCVFAPIVEEFLFRRTVIGTLGKYGNIFAIALSSVAFGLFHGNFYQFFYCVFLGLVLGFIFVKSGNWWLCVIMHSVMNFLGGVLPILIEKIAARYGTLAALLESGENVNKIEMFLERCGIFVYDLFSLLLFTLGLILTVIFIIKKKHRIENDPEIVIPTKDCVKAAFLNAGSIIFLVFSAFAFILSLFTV